MPRSFVYRIGPTGTGLPSQSDVDNNILCIMDNMEGLYGWSKIAIAGACGCFYEEAHMNPGIYEGNQSTSLSTLPYFGGGMGLAQWTDYPAYTMQYPNPLPWSADLENRLWYDGEFQCWLLTKANDANYTSMGYGQGPRWGWMTDSRYPSIAFDNYIHSTSMSVSDAVTYWFYDFEWHDWHELPSWVNFPARVAWGEYAYALMNGQTPEPPGPGPGPGPGPTPTSRRKMPLWMMLKPITHF